MKTVEFPYYLNDQIIELIMYGDGTYDYKVKTIKGISIDSFISLYEDLVDDFYFICFTNEIDSFERTIHKNCYIFSSLDKMNEFIDQIKL